MRDFEIINNFDVRQLSTIKIGGTIRKLYRIYTKTGLIEVMKTIRQNEEDYYVIGGCSKILFPDTFLRESLIQLCNDYIIEDNNYVLVGAGTPLKKLSSYMISKGYQGFEGLLSIPGQVGGAIVNNAGAFKNEISDALVAVTYFDSKKIVEKRKEKLEFKYRYSCFKNNNYIILEAKFKKNKVNKDELIKLSQENVKKRVNSQPQNVLTLGSTFKNNDKFIISKELENIGVKGLSLNAIQVSNKHTNFLININNSTQKNFLNILVILRTLVYNKLSYNAEFEVVILRW